MVTPMAMTMKRVLNAQWDATKKAQYNSVIQSVSTDMIFTRNGMDLWTTKLEMYTPIRG